MTMIRQRERFAVHSVFLTLQGEGLHRGRRAIFVRFSGCNIWSGRSEHRDSAAAGMSRCAAICDTDFAGVDPTKHGGMYDEDQLASCIRDVSASDAPGTMVVFTGGEPSLQLTHSLVRKVISLGFYTAAETNGTHQLPTNLDWVCVSPKPPQRVVDQGYDELKFLYPLFCVDPHAYFSLAPIRYLSPVDYGARGNISSKDALKACADYCRDHPGWGISTQLHKTLEIQ